jgi:hypothetical protein
LKIKNIDWSFVCGFIKIHFLSWIFFGLSRGDSVYEILKKNWSFVCGFIKIHFLSWIFFGLSRGDLIYEILKKNWSFVCGFIKIHFLSLIFFGLSHGDSIYEILKKNYLTWILRKILTPKRKTLNVFKRTLFSKVHITLNFLMDFSVFF